MFHPNNLIVYLFSDASNKVYGCMVYIILRGISSIITAKAGVDHLKNVSVPKPELTAVLLYA